MTKKILILFFALTFGLEAHAIRVFDPANFIQNLRTALQAFNLEINQLRQLENQIRDLQNKGDLRNPRLRYTADYYRRMADNDRRIYGALSDIDGWRSEVYADYISSGLSREDWINAERQFYNRGYDKQKNRYARLQHYRGVLNEGVAERYRLQQDNAQAAGTVETLQTTNEYLEEIIKRLDIVVENIITEQQEKLESDARVLKNKEEELSESEKEIERRRENLRRRNLEIEEIKKWTIQ